MSLQNVLPNGIVLMVKSFPARQIGNSLHSSVCNLQTRIGRKNITKKQLQEAPISFFAYDLLEYDGEDWRDKPLQKEEINWKSR